MGGRGYIKTTFKQWCIENDRLEWLDLWDYELNSTSPDKVSCVSGEKYYFKCQCKKHRSELKTILSITVSNLLICKACNSFGQWLIDEYGDDAIDMFWGDKNTKNPFSIGAQHNGSVWIKCSKHKSPVQFKTTCQRYVRYKNCSICTNNYVVRGINDVLTTHPHIEKYLIDINDGYSVTYASNAKIAVRCPHCGYEKKMPMHRLTEADRGFTCQRCGDGSSYSERFFMSFLDCLDVSYKSQVCKKTFEWCENKRYDFYIEKYNAMIEVHGMQHYRYTGFENSTEEEQKNDSIKERLAVENGVTNYIILDCRYSELEWIKNSIMNSKLPELLNFKEEDIDWNRIAINSNNSNVVNVCAAWNDGRSTEQISTELGLHRATVIRNLHKGAKLGMCDYQPNHTSNKYSIVNGEKICKRVVCDGLDMKFSKVGDLTQYMREVMGVELRDSNVIAVCNGKRPHHKGYTFRYVE